MEIDNAGNVKSRKRLSFNRYPQDCISKNHDPCHARFRVAGNTKWVVALHFDFPQFVAFIIEQEQPIGAAFDIRMVSLRNPSVAIAGIDRHGNIAPTGLCGSEKDLAFPVNLCDIFAHRPERIVMRVVGDVKAVYCISLESRRRRY